LSHFQNKKLGKEIYSKKATKKKLLKEGQAAQSRLGEYMGVFFVTRKWANNWDPLRTFLKYRCFAEKLTGQTLYFNDKVYCPKSDMLNLLQIRSKIEFVIFCRSNIKHKSTILCFFTSTIKNIMVISYVSKGFATKKQKKSVNTKFEKKRVVV